jgi:ornithine cyclodeaminase/alanine dehydrogenase-like protein (mu-crystallin family)
LPCLSSLLDSGTDIVFQNVLLGHIFEQASHNGELVHAVEAGVLERDHVTELGAVLAGNAPGRGSDEEITVFDSTGLAIQDLAVALAAMEKVDELDLLTIDL